MAKTVKRASAKPRRRTAKRKTTGSTSRKTVRKTTSARSTTTRKAAPKPTATARKKNAARAAASRKSKKPAAPAPSTLAKAATVVRGAVAGAVAAVAGKLPFAPSKLDALQLLERDHRRFEALLRQGEASTERAVKGRTELLDSLTRELDAHELKEEKYLYPVLREHPETSDSVLEGYQEHHVADLLVKELHGLAKDDEQWGAKFKVLKENIEHHIQEEEQEMFRLARGVLSRDELLDLGERMTRQES